MSTKHTTHHVPAAGDDQAAISVPASAASSEDAAFSKDIAFYKASLPGWADRRGQHVLIRGGAAHGFYPTHGEALTEGFRRFGREPFLVKRVDLEERPRPLAWVVR
jgi:hypothetical protein